MYTLYLPKYQGDPWEYLITKTIKEYMQVIDYDCVILLSPGYLSKTNNTIKMFVDKFSNTLTPCGKAGIPQIGIFNGMNGSQKTSSSSNTIRDEHNLQIRGNKKISLIDINCVSKRDHRKMMFFLKGKECYRRNWIFLICQIFWQMWM